MIAAMAWPFVPGYGAPLRPGFARLAAGQAAAGDPFSSPALGRYLAGREGDIDAAVYDAETGTTYCYHPALMQDTASIVKVDILATLLAEAQAAHRSLSATEGGLAGSMIEDSDNDAASDLWQDEGGASAVARFDARLGLRNTTPNFAWGLTSTTACDQVVLLRAIAYPDAVLMPASRSYELELMSQVVPGQRWGIPDGVPAGVPVAVKNGWLAVGDGWQINSDAYVHGGGRDYVVSVMTRGDPTEGYGIDTIGRISAYLWRDLAPRPGAEKLRGWH
jgi:beta-lactamase class A